MNGQTVRTPSGEAWNVRRCWVAKRSVRWQGRSPLRRRHRRDQLGRRRDDDRRADRSDWLEGLDFLHWSDGDNPLAALLGVVAVILVALLGWFLLVPLLLLVFDVAVLILLTIAGIAARTLLRRPWEIEAIAPDGTSLTWQVVGWQRSRRAIAAVTRALGQGRIPPTDSPDFPPP